MDLITILPTHFIPYGCKRLKVSQIGEGVGMIVFILKISELGSDRYQDDAAGHRRLFIFLDQGNISKLCRRPQTRF